MSYDYDYEYGYSDNTNYASSDDASGDNEYTLCCDVNTYAAYAGAEFDAPYEEHYGDAGDTYNFSCIDYTD